MSVRIWLNDFTHGIQGCEQDYICSRHLYRKSNPVQLVTCLCVLMEPEMKLHCDDGHTPSWCSLRHAVRYGRKKQTVHKTVHYKYYAKLGHTCSSRGSTRNICSTSSSRSPESQSLVARFRLTGSTYSRIREAIVLSLYVQHPVCVQCGYHCVSGTVCMLETCVPFTVPLFNKAGFVWTFLWSGNN